MADHPLRPATRLRLGRPLPHQLADRPRAPLGVTACMNRGRLLPRMANHPWSYPALARLSTGYFGLQGRLPTCYSPVRRFTRRVAPTFSHDLHVSGTPPAFVLSQDQTLQKNLTAGLATTAYAAGSSRRDFLDSKANGAFLYFGAYLHASLAGPRYCPVVKDQKTLAGTSESTLAQQRCQLALEHLSSAK